MMRAEDSGAGSASPLASLSPQKVITYVSNVNMRFQHLLDSTAPFNLQRWGVTGVLLLLFMLRIVLSHGWYIGALKCGHD